MKRSASRWLSAVGGSVLVAALVALGLVGVPMASASGTTYYLSLGDSYSVGYQPNPTTGATGGASAGYTAVVAAAEHMTLENFGCGGATSSSLLSFDEYYCGSTSHTDNPDEYGPPALSASRGHAALGKSQVQDAETFITSHRGDVGLITVSIGGNDVTPCAFAAVGHPVDGKTSALSCVDAVMPGVETNVKTVVEDLHSSLAANDDSTAKIVGITYPDVLLGLYVNTGPSGSPANTPEFPTSSANHSLAGDSQLAFKDFINPDLSTAYTSVAHGLFVNVTELTDGYVSTHTTESMNLAAVGLSPPLPASPAAITVPEATDQVCTLTWYCRFANIHANDTGYTDIGDFIVAAL